MMSAIYEVDIVSEREGCLKSPDLHEWSRFCEVSVQR